MTLVLVAFAILNFSLAGWNVDLYLDKGHAFSLIVACAAIASGLYSLMVAVKL